MKAQKQSTYYQDKYIRKDTTWAVRINEDTKAYLQRITAEYGRNIGDFITDLVKALQTGRIVFKGNTFGPPEEVRIIKKYSDETMEIDRLSNIVEKQEKEIEYYKGQMKVKNDLLETVRETIRDELKNSSLAINNEPKNFPENKKEGIDLSVLYDMAKKRQITPQSVLDNALKRYR